MLEPLSKQIDLSGHPSNLVVYYTIRRVEAFSRYTVTPLQGLGATAPASAAGMALPPPMKGSVAAGAGNCRSRTPRIERNALGSSAGLHHDLPGGGANRFPARSGKNVWLEQSFRVSRFQSKC